MGIVVGDYEGRMLVYLNKEKYASLVLLHPEMCACLEREDMRQDVLCEKA